MEYDAAERFRTNCLVTSGSFLLPERIAWTVENLETATTALMSRDESPEGSKFLDRLKHQLSNVNDDIYIVIADAMMFYYLFPSSTVVKNETKRARILEVLSWRNITVAEDRLATSFDQGVGGVGMHYLSAQPYLMNFFMKFAELGKSRSIDFHSAVDCAQVADEIRESSKHVVEARHALLHLFFPDQFEAIVSDRHRAQIINRYSKSEVSHKDSDAALRSIREQLSLSEGRNVSFYDNRRSEWQTEDGPQTIDPAPSSGDPMPKYEQIMLPLLQLISDGEDYKESDLIAPLASQFALSSDDLARKLPSGPQAFANRVTWAKVNLRQAQLIDIPASGYVRLTKRGAELLAEDPSDLSRAYLKRYPEYMDFLARSKDGSISRIRPGNVWIEKTLVTGRPDRQSGDYAVGRALWSPKTSENGSDIYRFMRDVQAGDIVLHLTDNRGFSGISRAAKSAYDFEGVPGTQWEGRESYAIPLENFTTLNPSLARDRFFGAPYGEKLRTLKQSGLKNLFYTDNLELVQGGYLTPCPPALADVLNDAYMDLTGELLVETPGSEGSVDPPIAYSFEDLLQSTLWEEESLNELLDSLSPDRARKQVVLAGPPGTGKTWIAQNVTRYLTNDDKQRWRLVQFHPSYSYEQFVEGLRPESTDGAISFRPINGILLEMAARCRESTVSNFLIIDEMNRANLPRVLGELLFLFEYRKFAIDLPYTRDFSLPDNLFIVGTMNTADRSIRSIDAALRRRFEIFECLPDPRILQSYYESNTNQVPDLIAGFQQLNELLTANLDRHHTIGHTFFMAPVFSPKSLRTVWVRQIKPLIEEYFFDQPDQSRAFELETFWPSVR